MFKIAKKLTIIMLSASMIFSCSGIIAHAERVKDKKQQYYQEYEKIIKEANEKIGSKDFELLPIDEINEDDMLIPKEFQKTVNAAIQLDTQKPVIDGGRTGEILCLGVIKNSSGYIKQVSLSFEFYCNRGGGIEV